MALLETPIGRMRVGWEPSEDVDDDGQTIGIARCLNIQYATIPYRWAAPRPVKLPWDGIRDCATFGPGCPQRHEPLFNVKGVPLFGIEDSKSVTIRPKMEDEFNCLNLNVYMPASMSQDGSVKVEAKLPVFLWVHGGAYVVGSGNVDAYDGVNLVRRSLNKDMPMIFVSINYRLGILGFFHSFKLSQNAAEQVDVPSEFRSSGNLALVDAFYAVKWVKDNITHFGGDPDNITAIGESAGAAIINYLVTVTSLQVHIPRIILSSSTICSNPLMRPNTAQSWFRKICMAVGADERCDDPIINLRSMDVNELIEKTTFAESSFRPVWDDVTITSDPREVLFDSELWDDSLTDVVMGVCRNEPWMRKAESLAKTPNMEATIRNRVAPEPSVLRERAEQLYNCHRDLQWFDIPPCLQPQHRTHVAFEGHMRYYAPAHLVSESLIRSRVFHSGKQKRQQPNGTRHKKQPGKKRNVYRYLLSWTTSQYPADWPVTHTADILPTFLHKSLSIPERKVAYSFVDNMIAFVSGHKQSMSWQEYTEGGKVINELTSKGTWRSFDGGHGEFDLTDEYVEFATDVVKASIDAGSEGWPGLS